jgi:putative thioredoxin
MHRLRRQQQCVQLDQKLQKLTLDAQGAIRMIRFDVAMFPEAAAELQIKAFPATIALYKNKMVTSFGGVPSDKQLDSVFEQLMRVAGASSVKIMMDKANAELAEGNIPEAAKIFADILSDTSLKSEALALSGLARCALKEGRLEAAQEIVAAISSRYPKDVNNPEIMKAISSVELASNAGSADDLAQLEQKVKATPNDPELRYSLGVKYSAVGKNEEAINQLLESIKKDKHWNEQAARKHLLKVIESLGNDNDIALKGSFQFVIYRYVPTPNMTFFSPQTFVRFVVHVGRNILFKHLNTMYI